MTKEQYFILVKRICDKGKHRFRTNWFGVTWCVICGQLSSSLAEELKEEDKLKID